MNFLRTLSPFGDPVDGGNLDGNGTPAQGSFSLPDGAVIAMSSLTFNPPGTFLYGGLDVSAYVPASYKQQFPGYDVSAANLTAAAGNLTPAQLAEGGSTSTAGILATQLATDPLGAPIQSLSNTLSSAAKALAPVSWIPPVAGVILLLLLLDKGENFRRK